MPGMSYFFLPPLLLVALPLGGAGGIFVGFGDDLGELPLPDINTPDDALDKEINTDNLADIVSIYETLYNQLDRNNDVMDGKAQANIVVGGVIVAIVTVLTDQPGYPWLIAAGIAYLLTFGLCFLVLYPKDWKNPLAPTEEAALFSIDDDRQMFLLRSINGLIQVISHNKQLAGRYKALPLQVSYLTLLISVIFAIASAL